MSNRNALYWQKRAEQISNIQFKKADKLCKNIAKEYQKAETYIQERINLYYARYAKEYGVDLADAKVLLSPSELNNFKMTIEEFRKKAIENDDGRWTKELDEEYLRSRISRLEALKMDINNKINELSGKVNENAEEHLKRVYEDTYLKSITTYGEGLGIGNNFERLNDNAINKAIYTRWTSEKNFAGRLDDNKKTLLSSINKTITQGLITGASSDTMVEKLMKETKISRNRAINIIQTETTFVIGQANTQMYKDLGVEEYEIVETLDSVTCETCAEMDGKIGKVSEKVEGVNAPPFHPRCRGTTIPVSKYAEAWGKEKRVARDNEDNIYYTNSDTYNEWKKQQDIIKSRKNSQNSNNIRKNIEFKNIDDKIRYIDSSKSIEELQKRAKEVLSTNTSISVIDFSGGDLERSKQILIQYTKLVNEYNTSPTHNISLSNLKKNIDGLVTRVGSNKDCIIQLRSHKYVKPSDYRVEKTASAFNVVVDKENANIATLTHEFAHTFSTSKQGYDSDFWNELKKLKSAYSRELTAIDKQVIVDHTLNYTEGEKLKTKITISQYAKTNVDEFLAEGFCEAKLSSNPSKYSLKILEIVDKYFKKGV